MQFKTLFVDTTNASALPRGGRSLNPIDAMQKYIEEYPQGSPIDEFHIWLDLYNTAVKEDPQKVWDFLWKVMLQRGRWSHLALASLTDRHFRGLMNDEEYQQLTPLINDPDSQWRLAISGLLGETKRWPNPLLMQLVTQETEDWRCNSLTYLLHAAGLNVPRAMQLGHELNNTPGLITEEQIMQVIKDEKR